MFDMNCIRESLLNYEITGLDYLHDDNVLIDKISYDLGYIPKRVFVEIDKENRIEEQKKEQTDGLFFVDFTNFQFVFSLGETRRRMTAFPQQTVDQEKVQKNKDQTCKNELQLVFLGSEKQPLFECKCECNFECNCRFSRFSEVLSNCQKPLKNKAFPNSIVSYLSFSDASSPVSRTTEPLIFQGFCFFLAAFHPNPTPTDLILGWGYTPWDMVG
jgi:hypothetical protein